MTFIHSAHCTVDSASKETFYQKMWDLFESDFGLDVDKIVSRLNTAMLHYIGWLYNFQKVKNTPENCMELDINFVTKCFVKSFDGLLSFCVKPSISHHMELNHRNSRLPFSAWEILANQRTNLFMSVFRNNWKTTYRGFVFVTKKKKRRC